MSRSALNRSSHRFTNFFYCAPWHLTRWWWFKVGRGGDEYHNPSVFVILPFLGQFVFFWRADRSGPPHDIMATDTEFTGFLDPDCEVCMTLIGTMSIDDIYLAARERWRDDTYQVGTELARVATPGDVIWWRDAPRLIVSSHVRHGTSELMSIWFEGDKQETILPHDVQLMTLRERKW